MPTSFNRAARGRLHRIALATLVSFALVGTAGVAGAQEAAENEPAVTTTVETTESKAAEEGTGEGTKEGAKEEQTSTSTQTEEPAPGLTPFDVSVLTDCWPDGYGEVTVFLRIAERDDVEYTVTLEGHDPEVAEFDEEGGFYFVLFPEVAAGVHTVTVTGTDGSDVTTEADLENCEETEERPDKKLDVWVECKDGLGVVTIQVYNPDTEKSKFWTIAIDDFGALPPYEEFEFFPDVVAKITEIGEDGTYEIKLLNKRGKLIDSETITIACAEQPTTTTTPSTTTPPAQGGPTPPSGELPTTGVAVRGVAVLGVLALVLGAALVFVGRRRRGTAEGIDA